MAVKASTPGVGQAKAGRPEPERRAMTRIFLIVVAAGLILLSVGALILGAFPPNPSPHEVQKVLPNDRFQTH